MTKNTDRLSEVIEFLDTDTISADELARAMTLVGSMPVEDILKLRPIDLAKHIIQVQKDAPQDASSLTKREDLTPAQCSKIAKQLIESLGAMYGTVTSTPQDVASNGLPRDVRVTLNKSIDQMTLKELLELLAGDATQYDDVLPYIRRSEPYRQAYRRTVNCVIPSATGTGLDPKATLDYIAHLNTPGTHIQRHFMDRRPTTIERAFKRDDRPLVNVFTQEPTNGPDAYGRDWGNLSADFHEALVWARKTQHAGWPTGGDFFALTGEIMKEKLNTRWQGILDDYLEAKADDDPTTVGISRYYDARRSIGRSTDHSYQEQPPAPEMTEEDYKQALYDIAEDSARVSNGGLYKSNVVIRSFRVSNGGATLHNVIVLESSHVSNGGMSGSFFKPNGVTVTVSNGPNSAQPYSRNWQQLYAQAQRMGLIPS